MPLGPPLAQLRDVREGCFLAMSCRLPPYLTVQMVRFFYKAATQQKAKILRKVRPCPSTCPWFVETLWHVSMHPITDGF
jgi:hypothetical protein